MSAQNGNGHKLTPTLRRLYDLLASDGMVHPAADLMALLPDPEYTCPANLNNHLMRLRKVIELGGQTVASVNIQGRTFYQLVVCLPSQND